jgi:DNA-binding transcriptional ArsR family regulator
MSRKHTDRRLAGHPPYVVFAALGDATRLALVMRLSSGQPCSISELTEGSRLTRQAITKHLRVLAKAGIVRCMRSGREALYEFQPRPIVEMHEYLEQVSRQWDLALSRLKAFVEQ